MTVCAVVYGITSECGRQNNFIRDCGQKVVSIEYVFTGIESACHVMSCHVMSCQLLTYSVGVGSVLSRCDGEGKGKGEEKEHNCQFDEATNTTSIKITMFEWNTPYPIL